MRLAPLSPTSASSIVSRATAAGTPASDDGAGSLVSESVRWGVRIAADVLFVAVAAVAEL